MVSSAPEIEADTGQIAGCQCLWKPLSWLVGQQQHIAEFCLFNDLLFVAAPDEEELNRGVIFQD